ncbi:MAG: RNA polymerase sigma factor [Bacteroidetes bacterium]|nr:RNA polymerase sigma factor [Bacteroidota bacterium]
MGSTSDKEEFLAVLRQFESLIYKVCNMYASNTEDLKDLFQEIILQAWTAYPRFRGESAVSTWLYRVALNTAITHKRKQKNRPDTTGSLPADLEDNTHPILTEEYKIMQQLIGLLPPLDKALVLLYMEDRSHAEIAEIMGISISNVGTKIARIKERLRKKAEPYINDKK